jgi:hypothetical protein
MKTDNASEITTLVNKQTEISKIIYLLSGNSDDLRKFGRKFREILDDESIPNSPAINCDTAGNHLETKEGLVILPSSCGYKHVNIYLEGHVYPFHCIKEKHGVNYLWSVFLNKVITENQRDEGINQLKKFFR